MDKRENSHDLLEGLDSDGEEEECDDEAQCDEDAAEGEEANVEIEPPAKRRHILDQSNISSMADVCIGNVPTNSLAQCQEIFSFPQARLECDEYIRNQRIFRETEFIAAKNVVRLTIRKQQIQDVPEVLTQSNLSDKDIRSILSKIPSSDGTEHETFVSVVFCPLRPGRHRNKAVPVSKQTYLAIEQAFGLPPIALQVLSASFFQFFNFMPRLGSQISGQRGLILSANLARFCDFTLISVYDDSQRTTKAICFGLSNSEISTITKRVVACPHTAHHFMTIPLLLVDYGVEELKYFTEARRAEVREIRKSLQMESYLVGNERQTIVDPTKVNLPHATSQVTSLSQSVIGLSSRCRALQNFVWGLSAELNHLAKATLPGIHMDENICQSYRQRLKYLNLALFSAGDQLKASYEALQVQAQTIYSLTAQADNVQNLISAENSRQIAETSLRTAEQSKLVAETALRDSTDMRIIAAVTLFFLPGTFTATLFSTSFFNFQINSSGKGKTVTQWIWLYWTVTATLTLLVMGGWGVMSYLKIRSMKVKDKEDMERLSEQKF